ncbi:MAG: ABC transporter ATP-binding protein [Pseudomonadota bacterium]
MLDVRNLEVSFATRRGNVAAVRGIDLHVDAGETLGIVGESGSGKSVTSYAVMRLLDPAATLSATRLNYGGIDLLRASERDMRDLRGREISMIFQNPRAALNPIRTVGQQISDVLRQHVRAGRSDARSKAIAAMEAVEIRDSAQRFRAYPFELSGGMCQRIVIALALACDPRLLIADEPTTGLDITTQKTVMDLIAKVIRQRNMGAVLITHDLGLAAEYCDRVMVMKDGRVVEQGVPDKLFQHPVDAYTRKLVDANPRAGTTVRELLPNESRSPMPCMKGASQDSLISVDRLGKIFATAGAPVHAVREVSFSISRGGSLGLVGESGSGKSTVSSIIARLADASSGTASFAGADLFDVPAHRFARDPRRARIQMVFQDATDSLNPRHTARQSLLEPIKRLSSSGAKEREARVRELADLVGLPHVLLSRFPHQLSGGQKARVGIARAIAVEPDLLILDEPTAALDVSIQAVILNLLVDLRARLSMTYLFVSHDLQVVRMLCDDVVVMKAGAVVEQGPVSEVLHTPAHDYTKSLIAAAPKPPARVESLGATRISSHA